MEQISNAEKQARYRKKEQLRRRASEILLNWQMTSSKHHLKGPNEIRDLIEEAIKLPTAWTEKDYENAEKRLDRVYFETVYPADQLPIDVREGRNVYKEHMAPAHLRKLEENTDALAFHIISALKISRCSEAEQAAALMQALRFVGRNLTGNSNIPCSQATAISLASIGTNYKRPDWLAEKLAEAFSNLFEPDVLNKFIKNLNTKIRK